MGAQKELDELAESIKAGLAKNGVHVLDESELSPILNEHGGTDFEKRLHLENFARVYDFSVHWSTFLQVAIFRTLDPGAHDA